MQETWVDPQVWKIPRKRKGQLTLVFLPGKIPWTEEPDRLQSMKSQSDTTQQINNKHRVILEIVLKTIPASAGSPSFTVKWTVRQLQENHFLKAQRKGWMYMCSISLLPPECFPERQQHWGREGPLKSVSRLLGCRAQAPIFQESKFLYTQWEMKKQMTPPQNYQVSSWM